MRDYERLVAERNLIMDRRARDYAKALIQLAERRPEEAIRLLQTGQPAGPQERRGIRRRYTLAQAMIATGKRDQAAEELRVVAARAPYSGDADLVFPAMILLAREEERQGHRNEALSLYRRVAHQYRRADPGFKLAEEARAGAARLERAGAQAAAD